MKNNDDNKEPIDETELFIDINLSDQLVIFKGYINSINELAYNSESFRILPFLNRNLLENLLRDIFVSSLKEEYNYLYYDRGRIRNLSNLLEVFKDLRKNLEESYAINIPDEIIGHMDKFRKDGNYTAHEIETHISTDYADEIRERFSATLRVLFHLYQKIINSDKKIEKIDEKFLKHKGGDRKLRRLDTNKILSLISSLRNDIINIKYDRIRERTSITNEEKEQIQEKLNELLTNIIKSSLNNESIDIVRDISNLEKDLHSEFPYQPLMKEYIEQISNDFKIALLRLSINDSLMVNQDSVIKRLKVIILIMSIGLLIIILVVIFKRLIFNF